MGTKFIESGADYSAISLGHAGLYTSVTAELKALHELRRSASKAINNGAPLGATGSIAGAPVFSDASASVSTTNKVMFGVGPVNGASTMAVVVKMRNGGVSTDCVAGVLPAAPLTTGTAYFSLYNRRLSFETYTFPSGSVPPLTSGSTRTAYLDFLAASDGLYEMFFGVVENNVSLRLYHPKTGMLVTTSAVGRDFVFNTNEKFQAVCGSGPTPQDEALFGYWEGALNKAQMDTFYGDIKPQYAKLGLVI